MSKTTKKTIGFLAGVAAVGLAGAYAYAQEGPGFGPGRMGMGPGMGPGMMMGMGPGGMAKGPMMQGNLGDPANRLATLKSELGIRPEQTAAWDAYAKVVTATATEQSNHARHIDPSKLSNMKPVERQQHFTAMQAQREAAHAKVKAAAETLVAALDDTQKANAATSLPGIATAGPGMRLGMMGGQGIGPGAGHGGMGPHRPR